MGLFKLKDQIYERPWGNHTGGIIRLVYNSGSYATLYKIKGGAIVDQRSVEIKSKYHGYNIDAYAYENGLTRVS